MFRGYPTRYATSDGTATAGADYTADSGTLSFAIGETEKTVSVDVLDDTHDEGSETMTFTLSNPVPSATAKLGDATATGTINNSDPMPQAWIARFGRTVAEQVLDAVESRMQATRTPGVEVSLAGQRISGGPAAEADIIRLLLLTGCRRGEILGLRRSGIQTDGLVLADSKTGPRRVPLNSQARAILDRQPRTESPFVFPSPLNPSRPRSRERSIWDRVRQEAGIEDVRLHDLRHTHASHAVMNGVPVPVVSRMLGHSNVRMTLRYAHLGDREIEAEAERIGAAIAGIMEL